MALLDLDNFGTINRVYGYPTGDRALQTLADILRQHVRVVDWVARYGGEEFCLVMPDTSVVAAVQVANRIRTALSQQTIMAYDGRAFQITASIGVVALCPHDSNKVDFVQRASNKVRQAKDAGRDRVCE